MWVWDCRKPDIYFIIYFQMLKKYLAYIEKGVIPYYWYKKFNLLKDFKHITLSNISNRLKYIIKNIDGNPDNTDIVSEYLSKYCYNILDNNK